MAGVTVADSLRSMVNLAKDANVEELHLEKARLETRLDAVNRLLEWREKIGLLMEAANAGPAVPVQPQNGYVPPAVRIPPSAYQQSSVDERDPPPRTQLDREDLQTSSGVGPEAGIEADDAEALKRTSAYLRLPAAKRASAFAEKLSKMVLACGRDERTVGYASPAAFVAATGMTRHYVGMLLADHRVKARIERVGHGQYRLTAEGRGLYKALTSSASDGAGCA